MADKDKMSLWLCLPESIVVNIFSYLTSNELQRAGCSCRTWLRISHDELLWKNLLYREWKINRAIPLPPGHSSYYREFRRLQYRVPTACLQELTDHNDQVLHVSFSHNGKLFASCSKDGTIKVWKSGPPASLKYSQNMKEQFRWQFTQFSQFNSSDSLLLVSGVHFGPNSTSGEIAVFNLKEDFALQARVQNKPYDIFGCWLNNAYLLSGNLHYLGQLSSCSALWLNRATQEADSEQESVVMRLFKFLNMNASTVRGITVANCRNLGKGKEVLLKQLQVESSREVKKEGETEQMSEEQSTASRIVSSSESEPDIKVSSACESDTELTASEPDSEQRRLHHQDKDDQKTRSEYDTEDIAADSKSQVDMLDDTLQSEMEVRESTCGKLNKISKQSSKSIKHKSVADMYSRNHPLKREASDSSVTPPGSFRKSLRKDGERRNAAKTKCDPNVADQSSDTETSHSRLWFRVRNAEVRRGRQNVDEDLMKILIYGVEPACPEEVQRVPRHSPGRIIGGPSTSHCDQHSLRTEEVLSGVGSRCSSTDTVLSSTDTDYTSLTFAGESGSGSDIVRAWGKKFTFGSTESLDEESLVKLASESKPGQTTTKRPVASNGEQEKEFSNNLSSSSQSDSQEVIQRSKIRRRRTLPKEDSQHKHLIFMRGAVAYTPHQICIKHINSSMMDTVKGPLGVSKQLDDARSGEVPLAAGLAAVDEPNHPNPRPQLDFDKVDHVIDLHGQILGLALSPDHRFLCVNCRSWPKDYHVADALAPPPIAQEIEVRMYDLYTLMEVKRFRGHRAFSPNDECNIIFLSVSDLYVASGAEDRQGYIWDRHYGILLARLPHTDMVNCVSFNPLDPEMLISASDDHTLKIWYSKNRVEQMTS
ncbi:F-box/WD repeat-containing protein 5 [Strongylocentrotus purpuratus]|uniref:F-box domain-containing protein n=1 Tax=Strongylocentrotus purpuratus TaxID=7668 RepID=A0A7M7PRU7_STRPU|nr:F-box/WD repeat-containing protein 5 [Strongylocentrotus purpuratus]|eukprot:XP_788822.2 PREDICTED: F-box/WD repeat-containing protein 5 [Strongylocentrotus purpuratus]